MIAAAQRWLGAERQTNMVRGWRLGGGRRERGGCAHPSSGGAAYEGRVGVGLLMAQRQRKGERRPEESFRERRQWQRVWCPRAAQRFEYASPELEIGSHV